MALQDKSTFIADIEEAATALSEAWADTFFTNRMTENLLSPMHPLREFERMIDLNAGGIFTVDDDYITESYAGKFPSKGTGSLNKIANPSEPPSILFSRVIITGDIGVDAPANGEIMINAAELAANVITTTVINTNDAGGGDQAAIVDSMNGVENTFWPTSDPTNFIVNAVGQVQAFSPPQVIYNETGGANMIFPNGAPLVGDTLNFINS